MGGLCANCIQSIWCPTWGETKCRELKARIYGDVNECSSYKKRGKDFKEVKCQCKDCLKNDSLYEGEE